MTTHQFIFSDEGRHRVERHVAFFGILGIAFFLQSIVPGQSIYSTAFFSLCCFFPTCILSVYICLYFLHNYLLQKKKYGLFLLCFVLLGLTCLLVNYLTAGLFLNLAADFGKPGTSTSEQMNLSIVNTSHALIIGGLALGIKLAKNIYLRQKENSQLSRQKIITDLRLEKTRIYPRLLYQSLDHLRTDINAGAANASSQLLKVSELLSYILYDPDEKWEFLEKELLMMQYLIDIGQSGKPAHAHLRMNVSGDTAEKFIIPMTLFPLMENFFRIADEQPSNMGAVTLDIYIKTSDLDVRLAIDKTAINFAVHHWTEIFSSSGPRLEALYPGGCQIKIINEKKAFIVVLNVKIKTANREQQHYTTPYNISYAEA